MFASTHPASKSLYTPPIQLIPRVPKVTEESRMYFCCSGSKIMGANYVGSKR